MKILSLLCCVFLSVIDALTDEISLVLKMHLAEEIDLVQWLIRRWRAAMSVEQHALSGERHRKFPHCRYIFYGEKIGYELK